VNSVRTLPPLAAYTLGLGDDALIVAQRLGEWVARAPQIEEDVALANIALDLLGQARILLSYAGAVEGAGRDEDDLAYLRDDRDFRNVQLAEIPNGDFAVTIARQLVFSAYQYELYTALLSSGDATLAGLAGIAALSALACVVYGYNWTPLWIYVSAAAGMILAATSPRRVALLGVLFVGACYAFFGWLSHLSAGNFFAVLLPVVLVGLAAKNAILIVEFARQKEDHDGDRPEQAATAAAKTRLRPILMTSFAFILGVFPLAIASGAGSEMRQSLGTAVFFGMIGVTVFGLLFTPAFYTFVRKLGEKKRIGDRVVHDA